MKRLALAVVALWCCTLVALSADELRGKVIGVTDGDTLTLRGFCERAGAVRIGLGEVSGTVAAA